MFFDDFDYDDKTFMEGKCSDSLARGDRLEDLQAEKLLQLQSAFFLLTSTNLKFFKNVLTGTEFF